MNYFCYQEKFEDLNLRIAKNLSKLEQVDKEWKKGKEWSELIYFPFLLHERHYCHFKIEQLRFELKFDKFGFNFGNLKQKIGQELFKQFQCV